MIENIERFLVKQEDGQVHIVFYDMFDEEHETYVLPREDAFKVMLSIAKVLNSPVWDNGSPSVS